MALHIDDFAIHKAMLAARPSARDGELCERHSQVSGAANIQNSFDAAGIDVLGPVKVGPDHGSNGDDATEAQVLKLIAFQHEFEQQRAKAVRDQISGIKFYMG